VPVDNVIGQDSVDINSLFNELLKFSICRLSWPFGSWEVSL